MFADVKRNGLQDLMKAVYGDAMHEAGLPDEKRAEVHSHADRILKTIDHEDDATA